MAKRNKEFEYRMQGIMHAREVVKRSGLEGLEKDILNRGILRVPLSYTEGQIQEFWDDLSKNLYTTMLTVTCMTLHDAYGLGIDATRCEKCQKNYDSGNENYRMAKVDKIISILEAGGFKDAA